MHWDCSNKTNSYAQGAICIFGKWSFIYLFYSFIFRTFSFVFVLNFLVLVIFFCLKFLNLWTLKIFVLRKFKLKKCVIWGDGSKKISYWLISSFSREETHDTKTWLCVFKIQHVTVESVSVHRVDRLSTCKRSVISLNS